MFDFVKRHIIDIIGIMLTVLLIFYEKFAAALGAIAILGAAYLRIGFLVIAPMFFAMNIVAYKLIEKNKATAVVPALFGGTIGGYIAIHTVNIFYCRENCIRIFFRIFIWICILMTVLFLLIWFGYYDGKMLGIIE